MAIALQVDSITKSFDDTSVVKNISFAIETGEFLTLLGPSGCGKTTTLRLIAGFEQPDSGSICINGQIVANQNDFIPAEKRKVGMVFQDYALFPHLSVIDNIAFGLNGQRKEKQKRADAMLELVGLSDFGDRMPYELSGGQQQRVALARALAPQPDIVLLDEPFSNLDAALRTEVRGEVRSILREAGTSTIFVTHDQEEALSLSDKVAVIFEGKLHQIGTPSELYTRPVNQSVASFIGEANILPATAYGSQAESALGTHRLLSPKEGAVEILIRPDMLHLQPTDEGKPAVILWREYYGHHQRIGLQLEDGTQLIARVDTQIMYNVGQNIRVSVYAPLLAFD
ncbi:MAG: ABC transporter ATP-binding protein [Anaerolineae bacterium]|nr:ABC transporter ATP-binding protein [Anaerolineae bacterium]